jgi:hypothetical protein
VRGWRSLRRSWGPATESIPLVRKKKVHACPCVSQTCLSQAYIYPAQPSKQENQKNLSSKKTYLGYSKKPNHQIYQTSFLTSIALRL